MCKYSLYESGTICSFCQTCPSPYIWVPNELASIIYDCLSGSCFCFCLFSCFCGSFVCFFLKSCLFLFPGFGILKRFLNVLAFGILYYLLRFLLCIFSNCDIFGIYISGHRPRLYLSPLSDRTDNLRSIIRI